MKYEKLYVAGVLISATVGNKKSKMEVDTHTHTHTHTHTF